MELSLLLAEQISQLFIIMFIGFLLVKSRLLSVNESVVISKLVLFAVAPCAILSSFMIEFTPDKLVGLGLAFLGAIIVHVIYLPLTKILSKYFHFNSIEQASIIYSNSGNLIIPLVGAVLGKEWVLYTSGYMVVQTILLWTHCQSLVSGEKQFSLKKIFRNINVIAIIIGLVLFMFQLTLPSVIVGTVDKVGSMVGTLAMLVIGMLIGQMNLADIFKDKRTYIVAFFRLIVYPVIMVVIFRYSGLANINADAKQIFLITILAASAPAAATITQFAQLYKKQPTYAGIMNVFTVIFSIITMPLMVMLYQIL